MALADINATSADFRGEREVTRHLFKRSDKIVTMLPNGLYCFSIELLFILYDLD